MSWRVMTMLDRENQANEPASAIDESGRLSGTASGETKQEAPRQTKGRGRGFASMDAAKQREIASKGGKAAHAKGTAHEFTSEEAREAGRKGGQAYERASKTPRGRKHFRRLPLGAAHCAVRQRDRQCSDLDPPHLSL